MPSVIEIVSMALRSRKATRAASGSFCLASPLPPSPSSAVDAFSGFCRITTTGRVSLTSLTCRRFDHSEESVTEPATSPISAVTPSLCASSETSSATTAGWGMTESRTGPFSAIELPVALES
ncbi:hypothetical protein D9M72_516330 [compost metagenome]